jgi:hypothetical protein
LPLLFCCSSRAFLVVYLPGIQERRVGFALRVFVFLCSRMEYSGVRGKAVLTYQ